MPMDLTKAQDHPLNVLRKHAQDTASLLSRSTTKQAFEAVTATLQAHEQEHGVTFAALDNEALARVAEAYAGYENAPYGSAERMDLLAQVADATRDLLGLGE